MNLGELVSEKRKSKGLWWQKALNLVPGCTPVSEACLNCWSAGMAHRQGFRQGISDYQWKLWGGLTTYDGKWNGEIRLLEENLELPLKTKKPTLFSVWNDLFHPKVPESFHYKFFEMVSGCKHHFFLVLTKRPENLLKFYQQCEDYDSSEFPNLGFGVTVELPKYLDRILTLCKVPAALRFVSLEPLLDELSISGHGWRNARKEESIHWVILGCESGRKRRPMQLEWGQKILNECRDAEVPAFLKQIEQGGKLIHAPKSLTGDSLQVFPEVEWKP